MITVEEWRAIPEYEGIYEVSTAGGVRSLDRFYSRNGVAVKTRGRTLKVTVMSSGHLSLHLFKHGKSRGFLVHRLVALTFLGPAPEGKPNVLHGDNNPANNHVSNLRWGSQKENMDDAVKAGTSDPWGHKRNPKPNCPQNHPYSGDNLYIDPRGRRVCRTCKREWARRKHNYKDFRV